MNNHLTQTVNGTRLRFNRISVQVNVTKLIGDDPGDYVEYRDAGGGSVEITDIQVVSSRRSGVGRALLSAMMSTLPPESRVFAVTRHDNLIAQQFYEQCGFEISGYLRRHYGHDEHAVVYNRKAGGPV